MILKTIQSSAVETPALFDIVIEYVNVFKICPAFAVFSLKPESKCQLLPLPYIKIFFIPTGHLLLSSTLGCCFLYYEMCFFIYLYKPSDSNSLGNVLEESFLSAGILEILKKAFQKHSGKVDFFLNSPFFVALLSFRLKLKFSPFEIWLNSSIHEVRKRILSDS